MKRIATAWLALIVLGCKSAPAPAPSDRQCATAVECEKTCNRNDALGCYFLGLKLANGRGVPKDPPAAVDAFDRACALGLGVGCLHAGIDLKDGVGGAEDASKAADYFRRGCDLQDPRACSYLATAYSWGRGVELDWNKAVALATRACDLGWASGCDKAGSLWLEGVHLPADAARANTLFAKGCALPGGAGYVACLNLAVSYRNGLGVTRDLDKARAYEEQANVQLAQGCNDGLPFACLQLSKHFEQGIGTQPDPAKAAEMHRHACELARSQDCPSPGLSCTLSIAECGAN